MASNVNSVKISVNNDEEALEDKPVSKKIAPQKKIVKKRVPAKAPAKKNKKQEKKRGGLNLIIAVIITAAICGGGAYAWQKDVSQKDIEEARKEAHSVRIDFETRLSGLKDKLKGVESKNEELEDSNKELEKKTEFLADAVNEFNSEELGLSFFYPAIFGEVNLELSEEGIFNGVFSENDKLIFGGISKDFKSESATATATAIDFLYALGFNKTDKKYYYRTIKQDEITNFELQPLKILDEDKDEILIVDKNSFLANMAGEEQIINIGENIGAIINLSNDVFPGAVFMNMDFGVLPMDRFEEMMLTMEVK